MVQFYKKESSEEKPSAGTAVISPTEKILNATTFAALDDESRKAILDLYAQYNLKDKEFTLEQALNSKTLAIFRNRISLTKAVELYNQDLQEINPASFAFLTPSRKEALRQKLLFGFFLLSAQYQLDKVEDRKQPLRALSTNIQQTAGLICLLGLEPASTNPQASLQKALENYRDRHCKYLALPMGRDLAKNIVEFTGGKTTTIKEWMAAFNERRLYWIWGEDLVTTLFTLIPDTFSRKQQAQQALHAPDYVMGNVAWSLYYARFSLDLSLLLKHTLKGKWMSEQESQIPSYERFKAQWNQRKFSLLNDFVWATVNLITFFWLVGKGMLGYWGDALTVALLAIDASLTFWRFQEETTKHNALLLRFNNDLNAIEDKISHAEGEAKALLQEQKQALIEKRAQVQLDRTYKSYQLSADLTYSVGLVLSYAVTCSLLIPPGVILPTVKLMIGMTGSVLCFALTLAYTAVTGAITITQTQKKLEATKGTCEKLLALFKKEDNENVKKMLYLDLVQHMAKSTYQAQVANFQKAELVRGILIDAMIPALVFVAFLFLPTGAGIGILAGGLALMALSKIILNQFEPKEAILPQFDEKVYNSFKDAPSLEKLSSVIDTPKDTLFEQKKYETGDQSSGPMQGPATKNS